MSMTNIRNALESALDAMQPTLTTAHEGELFDPIIGTPFQQPYLMAATPRNPTMGDGYYQEAGVFQINLYYPAGEGTASITDRAEAIRTLFHRGATFSLGGTTVQIDRTPSISMGEPDEGFVVAVVRTAWHADIYT
jgi:hypothetical protein